MCNFRTAAWPVTGRRPGDENIHYFLLIKPIGQVPLLVGDGIIVTDGRDTLLFKKDPILKA
jgi:hypothetical protein